MPRGGPVVDPVPTPIEIAPNTTRQYSKKKRPDGNWRSNRGIKARDRKIKRLESKLESDQQQALVKLKMEHQKRASAEMKLVMRSVAVTDAREESCSERKKRAATKKKVY